MSVKFKKNQDVSINQLGGSSPMLVFAIGWENKTKDGIISKLTGEKYDADLDLSCVMYDDNNDRIDCVWYAQLRSKCGSIRHKGDETVGEKDHDDESIMIDLNNLNENARTLFFVISSFAGDTFDHVDGAYWHLFDAQSKNELGRYEFSPKDRSSAKIVMRLQKTETEGLSEWRVKALDEEATGHNVQEMFPEIRHLIEA
jgi:tellurium resistance protein TerZ